MPPALALFSNELTTDLEFECKEAAKGTCRSLRMFNDFVFQPLLTVSVSKGYKVKEVMVFSSPYDTLLKYFREISEWLQNNWCPYIKNLPVNKMDTDAPNDENDAMNNTCDDSIVNFMNEDEDLNNPNADWNDYSECTNSK